MSCLWSNILINVSCSNCCFLISYMFFHKTSLRHNKHNLKILEKDGVRCHIFSQKDNILKNGIIYLIKILQHILIIYRKIGSIFKYDFCLSNVIQNQRYYIFNWAILESLWDKLFWLVPQIWVPLDCPSIDKDLNFCGNIVAS